MASEDVKIMHENMKFEKKRLESFFDQQEFKWPHAAAQFPGCQPAQLAKAGFFYSPNAMYNDATSCFCCGLRVVSWEPQGNKLAM